DVKLSGAPDGRGLRVGELPDEAALRAFSASAARDGRRLVVGAVITEGAGRVFVQRRSPCRALFRGAWDMVGGNAEPGEDALDPLRREVRKETGWGPAALGPLVGLIAWAAGGVARREVGAAATRRGALRAPALDADKHDASRWLSRREAALL